MRRGQRSPWPGDTRSRLSIAETRMPVIDEPAFVYCLNCGAGQRVSRPAVQVEPDPTIDWEAPMANE